LDNTFAKQTIFKSPISHGILILGVSLGLWFSLDLNNDTIVAFAGVDNLLFRAPVYPDDSVHLISEVISRRDSNSRPESGIVIFQDKVFNQKEELVLEFERIEIIQKKTQL
jgi:acyl dehydratase